jgi:hypothetical protein
MPPRFAFYVSVLAGGVKASVAINAATTVKQEVLPPDLSEEEALQLFITQTEL